jgi:hypothetical protein
MDPFPAPRSLASEELKLLLPQLVSREQEVSNTRQSKVTLPRPVSETKAPRTTAREGRRG